MRINSWNYELKSQYFIIIYNSLNYELRIYWIKIMNLGFVFMFVIYCLSLDNTDSLTDAIITVKYLNK